MKNRLVAAAVVGIVIGFVLGFFTAQFQNQGQTPSPPPIQQAEASAGSQPGLPEKHPPAEVLEELEKLQRRAKEHPEVIAGFREQIPMGDFGHPEDLGPLAVYLASDASRYMTGQVLIIDDGWSL